MPKQDAIQKKRSRLYKTVEDQLAEAISTGALPAGLEFQIDVGMFAKDILVRVTKVPSSVRIIEDESSHASVMAAKEHWEDAIWSQVHLRGSRKEPHGPDFSVHIHPNAYADQTRNYESNVVDELANPDTLTADRVEELIDTLKDMQTYEIIEDLESFQEALSENPVLPLLFVERPALIPVVKKFLGKHFPTQVGAKKSKKKPVPKKEKDWTEVYKDRIKICIREGFGDRSIPKGTVVNVTDVGQGGVAYIEIEKLPHGTVVIDPFMTYREYLTNVNTHVVAPVFETAWQINKDDDLEDNPLDIRVKLLRSAYEDQIQAFLKRAYDDLRDPDISIERLGAHVISLRSFDDGRHDLWGHAEALKSTLASNPALPLILLSEPRFYEVVKPYLGDRIGALPPLKRKKRSHASR